jgi:hypothetical protein
MGTLAYQYGRLTLAQPQINIAVADLEGISNSDPEADAAMHIVRLARTNLRDQWAPLVARVLRENPLGRDTLDRRDVRNALMMVMVDGYGWTMASDPLEDNSWQVTVEEARALGAMLNSDDLDRFMDSTEELQWLARQLQAISRDPVLSAEFLANFHQWERLLESFATAHREAHYYLSFGDERHEHRPEHVERAVGALGELRQFMPDSGHVEYPAWLDAFDPYAVGLIAGHLDLSDQTLARLAANTLDRWWNDEQGWTDYDWRNDVPMPADLFYAEMVERPASAGAFLLDPRLSPEMLWGITGDWEAPRQLLLAGTSPAVLSAAEAEELLVPLLEWIYEHGWWVDQTDWWSNWEDVPPVSTFAGELVAPWLRQFSPFNDDWGISKEHRANLLQDIAEDEDALQAMVARSEQLAAEGFTALAADGRHDFTLEEMSGLVGLLGQVVMNDRVEDEEERLAQWELMFTVVSNVVGFVPVVGTAASIGTDVGQGVADHFKLFGYPDPAAVGDVQDYNAEWAMTVFASGAMGVAVDKAPAGLVPASAPSFPTPDPHAASPAAEFLDDYLRWKEAAFDSTDHPGALYFDQFVLAALTPALAGASVAD